MSKIYIASKESIDSLSTDINSIKTTVNTNETNIKLIKDQVGTDTTTMQSKILGIKDSIGMYTNTANKTNGSLHAKLRWTNTQIGAISDDGGSTSSGTIMGKLNRIITDLNNTSGIAGVASNVTNIKDRLGTTTDTGGSSSAGTAMAKLNSAINYLNNYSRPAYYRTFYDKCPAFIGSPYYSAPKREINIFGSVSGSGNYWGIYVFPYFSVNPYIRIRTSSSSYSLSSLQFLDLNSMQYTSANSSNVTANTSGVTVCVTGYASTGSVILRNTNVKLQAPSIKIYPKGFAFVFACTSSFDVYVALMGTIISTEI